MKTPTIPSLLPALLLIFLASAALGARAPKIPLNEMPTVADVMAEYADDPPAVADAKRVVILGFLQRAVTGDLYASENTAGDVEVKQLFAAYGLAERSIRDIYGDDQDFDRQSRLHEFGFYIDENGNKAGDGDPLAFRLEFYDRHIPSYAAWVRERDATFQQAKWNRKKREFFGSIGAGIGPISAIAIILIFILAALGIPRGIASLSKDGRVIRFGGKAYNIGGITGKVLDARKDITTEISGGGGGGTIVDGRGTINIDPITSTTTVGDTVFLEDDEGLEHSVKMTDLDLALRPGHRLSVMALARPGDDEGLIMYAYNHSTRESFLQTAVAKYLLRPSWLWLLLTILAWIGAWQLLSLLPSEDGLDFGGTIIFILVGATWIEFFRRAVASLRFKRFVKGKAYRRFVEAVATNS